MDVYCPNCGEPWDLDSLHDEAGERYGTPFYLNDDDRRAYRRNPRYDSDAYGEVFAEVRTSFQQHGCAALSEAFGARCRKRPDTTRATVAGAMYDLLGDDLDGAAAMLEDFEHLGL